jgi:hypothetical protein
MHVRKPRVIAHEISIAGSTTNVHVAVKVIFASCPGTKQAGARGIQ